MDHSTVINLMDRHGRFAEALSTAPATPGVVQALARPEQLNLRLSDGGALA